MSTETRRTWEAAVAYPEKVLANDEKVVEHLHPHWITLVPATLWFILVCAAGGAGIHFAPDHGTSRKIVIIAVIVVGAALLLWFSFRPWLAWRTTHYVITSHRVLIRRGILKRTGRDIALSRISDVSFTQTLWDRMVGAGTLTIESAGENGQENLTNIPRSDQQQQLINRLIEEDSGRRGYGGQPYPQGPPPQAPQGPPPGQQYPPTQPYPQQ